MLLRPARRRPWSCGLGENERRRGKDYGDGEHYGFAPYSRHVCLSSLSDTVLCLSGGIALEKEQFPCHLRQRRARYSRGTAVPPHGHTPFPRWHRSLSHSEKELM